MNHAPRAFAFLAAVPLVILAACAQPAQPSPTAAPAATKPAEATKPTTAPPTPAAAASPATAASPAAAPKPAASPVAAPAASPSAAASPAAGDVTASARPLSPLPQPGNMPAGSFMKEIQDRGRLIAGARQDVPLFNFLNPRTNQYDGFDVDVLREIAKAIFNDDTKIEFRQVNSSTRIPLLQEGALDIVAATMTINAERKQQIDFSEVYYAAGQKLLVKKDSTATSIQDMAGKRVCATKGSTSETNITKFQPQAQVVQADAYTDCLLSLQQGRVDAVSTDDVILSGLADQDPNTKIVGEKFTEEPYGLGFKQGRAQFVPFVNGVLTQMKGNGRWKAIYEKWLGKFGPAPEPPKGTYTS
ncbi:MAG: glutamate ABC transporter substrate-binding protein [Chloroflexi bacterium]|nr:glutamate ABC transporter substrate-binding protein [Chloroflexota bacterium]